jgi:hypothetical protein
LAPELDDEKAAEEKKADAKKDGDGQGFRQGRGERLATKRARTPKPVKPIKVDLAGIESRIVALPLPAAIISSWLGQEGQLYFLETPIVRSGLAEAVGDAEPLDAGGSQDGEAGRACGEL